MYRDGRQPTTPEMKTRYPAFMAGQRGFALRFFDIVNGFLIDAVVHWCVVQGLHANVSLTDVVNLAEIIRPHLKNSGSVCKVVVDGVDSQA